MSDLTANAQRMVRLFAQMRDARPSPAIVQIKELNLSFSHMRVLHLLAPDRVVSMKDLAEELQITPPSVTALTRRLVPSGLVQRIPHPEDSRIMLLSLTEAGRSLQQQLARGHIERMTQLLQGLSEQEQQQFLDLLERAVNTLQSAAPQTDTPTDSLTRSEE